MTIANFDRWRNDAGALLAQQYDIESTRIRPSAWSKLYCTGCTIEQAAEQAAAIFLNSLSHADRLAFAITRGKRPLTNAERLSIKRQVKRRGR